MCVVNTGEQANGHHEQKQRLTLCWTCCAQCSVGFCVLEGTI